jgi:serine protease AprX
MSPTREPATSGRRVVAGIILALLFLLPSFSAPSAQAEGKAKLTGEVERALKSAAPDDMVPVIVQTTGDPSSGHFVRLHGRGGVVKARHTTIHGYSAKVPASQLEAFADDPEVEHVSYDSPVKAHMDVAFPAVKADLAIKDFNVIGAGVGVAVIDTGVAAHPDLQRPKGMPQVVEVEIVGHEAGLADYYGHGTHVAGIINGSGYSSSDRLSFRTFRGIAPGAQILSVRALYPDGSGYTSDIIAGIDWAVKNKSVYNIRVMNLSLGHPVFESYTTDPLCRAVRAASNAGILVVVAAGNDGAVGTGFGTIGSPGNEPSALTVGALDDARTVTTTDDVLAWYSSKGPSLVDFVVKPDMVAPGSAIVSLRDPNSFLDTNYHQFTLKIGDYKNDPKNALNDGVYYMLSGTSMAAPMVTGAAALMLQKDPSLNPATLKARLMVSSVKDSHLIFETGAGELDVDAALGATGYATSAMSPLAILGTDGNVYIQDTAFLWGADWTMGALWGGGKVEGNVVLTTSNVNPSLVGTFAALWGGHGGGGNAGPNSLIWNGSCDQSGLIWSGEGALSLSTTGTVTNDAALWGGGKH